MDHIRIRFTKLEKKKVAALAKSARLSFSNYVRERLGLPPLKHGGARKRREKE